MHTSIPERVADFRGAQHSMKVILKSLSDFFRDGGPLLAGSIAYFFLLSFVPFGLVLIALFGYFLGEHREFYEFLSARLLRFFPAATSEVSRQLTALIAYKEIGLLTALVYAYFSYQLYMAIEEALRVIFRQQQKRRFLISVLLSLVIITLIAALIFVSFVATAAVQMLQSLLDVFPSLRIGKMTGHLARFVVPVLVVFFTVTLFYTVVPMKNIPVRQAFKGALFTTLFLEIARHFFTAYIVATASHYGVVYGSLSTVVIFLLWVFYSACIFLIGAEVVRNLTSERGRRE